jgi:hypothetical protein
MGTNALSAEELSVLWTIWQEEIGTHVLRCGICGGPAYYSPFDYGVPNELLLCAICFDRIEELVKKGREFWEAYAMVEQIRKEIKFDKWKK